MIDFIREFKFGRPQQIAALLLMAFLALAVRSATQTTIEPPEASIASTGSNLLYGHAWARCSGCDLSAEARLAYLSSGIGPFLFEKLIGVLPSSVTATETQSSLRHTFRLMTRTPFVVFGLWLAGALWWVTRRLYNDNGGYVALALFCFSLPMIFYSSRVSPDIIAAWGLYGLIYTAIGVAHTLYAPARRWRPRILLLGTALGVTASAYFVAALIGLVFAVAFMLYLAPGRRKESLGIVAIACLIAALFLFALYGFDFRAVAGALTSQEAWAIGFHRADPVVPGPQWLLIGVLTFVALITYAAWRRARYFGNTAPVIVMTALYLIHHDGAQTAIWALPFVFTFIGGIFADLLETRRRKLVAWSLGGVLASYAALAVAAVLTIPK